MLLSTSPGGLVPPHNALPTSCPEPGVGQGLLGACGGARSSHSWVERVSFPCQKRGVPGASILDSEGAVTLGGESAHV